MGVSANYIMDEETYFYTEETTFDDVDPTNLSLTICTSGGDVLVSYSGGYLNNIPTYFDIDIDGTRFAGDDGIWRGQSVSPNFSILVPGLSAGNHTFKLQWKTGGANSKLHAGNGVTGIDLIGQFFVVEL